jgi:hypothetical protein
VSDAAAAAAAAAATTFGNTDDVLTTVLAAGLFFLVIYVTLGAVVVTYINWVYDKNEKESLAEMKVRIDQFAGEKMVRPEYRIFATVKTSASGNTRRTTKPFLNVDTLSRTLYDKPRVAGQVGLAGGKASSSSSSSSSSKNRSSGSKGPTQALVDDNMNRTSRRMSAKEQKRREKEDARREQRKADREKSSKGKNGDGAK